MGRLINNKIFELDVKENGKHKRLEHIHQEAPICHTRGCPIHAPSDHPLKDAPQDWSFECMMMTRKCKCGKWHPDHDARKFGLQRRQELKAQASLTNSEVAALTKIEISLETAKKHSCCAHKCCQEAVITKARRNPNPLIKN